MTHKPSQLSGGEQQRVAIARALFNEPSVVLADEPTGNLDENTGKGIIDLLFELNASRGLTLVLVTHDLDLARRAHQWIRLYEGVAELQPEGA
jgi:predicted ABC-type transport system involved in lysophospholipase L1 biosynthesis ATPase subunit